ncbi:DsrE/DsrF/DrsH-like family protein [Caldisphaera sp.]|jgi:peroxiredoxin family protein|uniref:DsrE/DsrF/DrsH-like family protein n=1 Tax=Caldisphaera sp. TaxID=2060322 RepID=UPI00397A0EDD
MLSRLSIILYSGTDDKLIPVGVIAQGAAALGMDVQIFVTGWALTKFTKKQSNPVWPKEFENMVPMLMEGMKKNNAPSWVEMVKEAKSMGAKVYACSLMASVMGLKKEDFNELIDDVVGVATFLQQAEGGQTLFI